MNRISVLIKQINGAIEKYANNMLKKKNLTLSQMRFLRFIKECGEEKISLKNIENHFSVSQPTVVGIIKRLEEKGLVTVCHDDQDRRIKNVFLTAKGMACCEDTYEKMEQAEHQVLDVLSQDELDQLKSILTKIHNTIKDL